MRGCLGIRGGSNARVVVALQRLTFFGSDTTINNDAMADEEAVSEAGQTPGEASFDHLLFFSSWQARMLLGTPKKQRRNPVVRAPDELVVRRSPVWTLKVSRPLFFFSPLFSLVLVALYSSVASRFWALHDFTSIHDMLNVCFMPASHLCRVQEDLRLCGRVMDCGGLDKKLSPAWFRANFNPMPDELKVGPLLFFILCFFSPSLLAVVPFFIGLLLVPSRTDLETHGEALALTLCAAGAQHWGADPALQLPARRAVAKSGQAAARGQARAFLGVAGRETRKHLVQGLLHL